MSGVCYVHVYIYSMYLASEGEDWGSDDDSDEGGGGGGGGGGRKLLESLQEKISAGKSECIRNICFSSLAVRN